MTYALLQTKISHITSSAMQKLNLCDRAYLKHKQNVVGFLRLQMRQAAYCAAVASTVLNAVNSSRGLCVAPAVFD